MKRKMDTQQRIAAKAFIVKKGKVLILRESTKYSEGTNAGRWDFPGGRLKPGENFIEALRRETKEECGLEVEVGKPIYVGEWRPTIKGAPTQIIGIFFLCAPETKEIKLSEDHSEFKWVPLDEYKSYDQVAPNDEVFEVYTKNYARQTRKF